MLTENSRGGDMMISAGEGDFLILLPDTSQKSAGKIAGRVRDIVTAQMFPGVENDCVKIIFGVATTSDKEIETPDDLLAAASDALKKEQEQKDRALTV